MTLVLAFNKCACLFYSLTPRDVGVSSKHVLAFFYYSNGVWLSITAPMERTCSPAVRGGAITQLPTLTWKTNWFPKSSVTTEEAVIPSNDAWLGKNRLLKKKKNVFFLNLFLCVWCIFLTFKSLVKTSTVKFVEPVPPMSSPTLKKYFANIFTPSLDHSDFFKSLRLYILLRSLLLSLTNGLNVFQKLPYLVLRLFGFPEVIK